jgi:hypothetical protein
MFDGLPEACFSVLPGEGKLIYIKRSEMGYWHSNWDTGDPEQNRKLADYHNEKNGVTKAQEEAMLVGSMFGWDVPGADPKSYKPPEQEVNAGYAITRRTTIGQIEIVLGERITAPDKYVTWRRTPAHEKSGKAEYYWGHYFSTKDAAIADYNSRVAEENRDSKDHIEANGKVAAKKRTEPER